MFSSGSEATSALSLGQQRWNSASPMKNETGLVLALSQNWSSRVHSFIGLFIFTGANRVPSPDLSSHLGPSFDFGKGWATACCWRHSAHRHFRSHRKSSRVLYQWQVSHWMWKAWRRLPYLRPKIKQVQLRSCDRQLSPAECPQQAEHSHKTESEMKA